MKSQLHSPHASPIAVRKVPFAIRHCLALGIAALLAHGAQATLFMEESFDYEPGTLAGNFPWTNAATPITVASGSLTYPGLPGLTPAGNAGRVTSNTGSSSAVFTQRPFDTIATSGTVYCAAILDFTGFGANITIMGLLPSSVAIPGTGANDPCDLAFNPVNPLNSAEGFKLGIRSKGQSSAYAPTVLHLNTVNLIVMKYDFSAKTASLFLNPTPGENEPASPDVFSTSTTAAVNDLSVFFLRAAGNTSTTPTFLIDDLRTGSTWEEALPQVVPEPATVALIAVGLLALAGWRRLLR
jgi:hypothetical protein